MNILTGYNLIDFLEEVFKAHRMQDIKPSMIFKEFAYFSNSTETCGVYFYKNELNNIISRLK